MAQLCLVQQTRLSPYLHENSDNQNLAVVFFLYTVFTVFWAQSLLRFSEGEHTGLEVSTAGPVRRDQQEGDGNHCERCHFRDRIDHGKEREWKMGGDAQAFQ